ncbi:UDP-N-acetylglucosamine--N-acetylmuramyl-(pentapeptide) pyrophosphoryl-undecaprenol N-acetylglucosamine transferase [Candidatus Sneabacter namystus]|uniref:UDP-N-acetylglucosamine--N-acetylmuramyl-(pentapeptide) pyrophosphoryl-undecaprenol N-acetylglucosamine transferase n=1 Tax=Candidatus Sneabacter namystus TaxID=2601646 RepID=A0A5C0UI37_9RICK|nr:UDP-N-acetylglucosamine--N-acetylmuramyl-(pentapeptide) pyrophosphoryl-undecaprenol N-acetylglucosamine transferase [Candidatus Sneabacter namystus]QEK39437.1 UDP-N-acetylglucosamine--N-acetylmuramyl-(pentapeptide) pyrophosphoryl-undecaprenol N-acetylglucosamine transferase [Candidatus Sneabacter namystus]
MNKKKFVVFVGGGTKGHLFAAIAAAGTLDLCTYETLVITDIKVDDCKNVEYIPKMPFASKGFLKYFVLRIITVLQLLIKYIKRRPYKVVGFGGYTSFCPLMAAVLLRIPIIIHEQNSIMGKANSFFLPCADTVSLGFFDACKVNDNFAHKCVRTYNPIRSQIFSASSSNALNMVNFNILILGGSQGASIFDSLIPHVIDLFLGFLRDGKYMLNVCVVQQTSEGNNSKLKRFYSNNMVDATLKRFFDDIHKRYNKADIVICRSGASTIEEIVALAKPAIFVPFPFAAQNHQLYNAQFLSNLGAAWTVEQNAHAAKFIAQILFEIVSNPRKLRSVVEKLIKLRDSKRKKIRDII